MAKNPHAKALGELGGKVKGQSKARTREQCQKAAAVKWANYYAKHPKTK
jgi:hypothetical protein